MIMINLSKEEIDYSYDKKVLAIIKNLKLAKECLEHYSCLYCQEPDSSECFKYRACRDLAAIKSEIDFGEGEE